MENCFEKFNAMSPTPTDNRLRITQKSLRRFLEKISIQESGCWLWTASKPSGYGQFRITEIEPWNPVFAHVLSYRLAIGEIPDGYHIHHKTENGCIGPACVNPAHLECVSPSRHIDLTPTCPTAINRNRTHCVRGHEFTTENTRVVKDGIGRSCRACEKIRDAQRTARNSSGMPTGRPPQTHCNKGHELSGDNLYVSNTGRKGKPTRGCKICRSANALRWHAANPEKKREAKMKYNANLRERSRKNKQDRIVELLQQVGTRDAADIAKDLSVLK